MEEHRWSAISIHAPLTGSDSAWTSSAWPRAQFQSTLPLRGATYVHQCGRKNHHISIHAPLTGSDSPYAPLFGHRSDFNPRSPYGERHRRWKNWVFFRIFQSTLPLRGATCGTGQPQSYQRISIHAPLTGSDYSKTFRRGITEISIHAPLTGSDLLQLLFPAAQRLFQSTLPLRGATYDVLLGRYQSIISIHAPLTGSDKNGLSCAWIMRYFNPRSPYGERHLSNLFHASSHGFQSTLPLRGATGIHANTCTQQIISIHAPLTGSDVNLCLHLLRV